MKRKKLHLDANDLRVESFEPRPAVHERGTVRAHGTWDTCIDTPCDPVPPDYTEPPCAPPPTAATCGYTCGSTCTCGCGNTRAGWTCNPYATECLPVPEDPQP